MPRLTRAERVVVHLVLAIWPLILTATIGVIVGTTVGRGVRGRISHHLFRRAIAVPLMLLGSDMALTGDA